MRVFIHAFQGKPWNEECEAAYNGFKKPVEEKTAKGIIVNCGDDISEYECQKVKLNKNRRNRMLAFNLIRKICVDVYPLSDMHYHIEVSENGDIKYSLPEDESVKAYNDKSLSFDSSIKEKVRALFLYDTEYRGNPTHSGFYWKLSFYNNKGLYYETEGWPGEEQWRRDTFSELLREMERILNRNFGYQYLKLTENQFDSKRTIKSMEMKSLSAIQDIELHKIAEISDKLFRDAAKKTPLDNTLISPISIEIILSIIMKAANGKTREELKEYLALGDVDFGKLAARLNKELILEENAVSIANGVYINHLVDFLVNKEFIESLNKDYSAILFNSDDSVKEINKWVRKTTRNMISSVVKDKSDMGDVAIVNAVAFEARWQEPYIECYINEGIFLNSKGQKEDVTMLHGMEEYYIFDETATGFIKPYKDCGYSFMALLPQQTKDPVKMFADMGPGKMRELFKTARRVDVDVTMPEFSFDCDLSVKKILEDCGVISIFHSETADITNLIAVDKSYVSNIIHKTHVEAERRGTRAAGETSAFVIAGCEQALKNIEVILNRPFVFSIVHTQTGIPLFQGVVNSVKS